MPDPERGEAVKAFVLLNPDTTGTPALAEELRRHVRRHLGAFQRPREVEWVAELPMTVSDKIKRAELRGRRGAEVGP
jgi:acetyl-CoA synthetase